MSLFERTKRLEHMLIFQSDEAYGNIDLGYLELDWDS
jgi:hypothetical protein